MKHSKYALSRVSNKLSDRLSNIFLEAWDVVLDEMIRIWYPALSSREVIVLRYIIIYHSRSPSLKLETHVLDECRMFKTEAEVADIIERLINKGVIFANASNSPSQGKILNLQHAFAIEIQAARRNFTSSFDRRKPENDGVFMIIKTQKVRLMIYVRAITDVDRMKTSGLINPSVTIVRQCLV